MCVWPCSPSLASVFLITPSFPSPSHRLARPGVISRKLEPGRFGGFFFCPPLAVRFQLTHCPVPIKVAPPAGRLAGAVGLGVLLLIGSVYVVSHLVSDGSVLTLWLGQLRGVP